MSLWNEAMRDRTKTDDISIFRLGDGIIDILLKDRTSKKNILWMTDNYVSRGRFFAERAEIKREAVTGANSKIIRPRVDKSKREQNKRIKVKAEVFTPSWICNRQNNLVDDKWFGHSGVFNRECENGWVSTDSKIEFPEGRTWMDYVLLDRLEITCGEAPYLVSRYDAVTGDTIDVRNRIGLYDRKLRVVSENTTDKGEWVEWAKKATQSIYGFEWQGDSLYLARLNVIYTFAEHCHDKFSEYPDENVLTDIAEIVSWNLWQMDGLKFVIPMSCVASEKNETDLFGDTISSVEKCVGCNAEGLDKINKHNGIYCMIMDWKKGRKLKAVDLLSGGGKKCQRL